MTDVKIFENLDDLLTKAQKTSGVPGCVAAVYHNGKYYEAAAGVVNFKTAVPVTTESVFQIGSITKSFTATLVMMMVWEGKIDLDATITDYLPDFKLAEAGAAQSITIRHLLSHTSGIDGDLTTDTGRGDDCLEKFVNLLSDAKQLHAPGQFFSYCNVGYIILGRVIEVLENATFETVFQQRLLIPLGLKHSAISAEEALFYNTAIGHEMDEDGLRHAETAYAPRSNTPSGTVLGMSARDLLNFARFHMKGGVTLHDERLMNENMAAIMQKPQVLIPLSSRYTSWGLGWMQYYWGGADTYGHDGGWMGMSAYLRISPAHDFAVVLFANGPNSSQLYMDVMDPLLMAGTGALPPDLPEPPSQTVSNLSLYCGRYARHGQHIDIVNEGGALKACLAGEYMDGVNLEFDLNLLQRDRASCLFPGFPKVASGYFLDFDDEGRPCYFHVTERAFRRLGDTTVD